MTVDLLRVLNGEKGERLASTFSPCCSCCSMNHFELPKNAKAQRRISQVSAHLCGAAGGRLTVNH